MKNKVKGYRIESSLTQEDLANKVNVSRQTIIAIESGRYLPSITLAFKLAKIFQVSIEDIFIYQED